VQNQFDNLSNSKQNGFSATAAVLVCGAIAGVAMLVLSASFAMPRPLSGRLHPAHMPAAVALMTLVAAGLCLARRTGASNPATLQCQPTEAAPWRGIVCAIAAVSLLALATRSLGLLPAVMLAGSVAALGVRGVGLLRAIVIGSGLALAAGALFVGLLRQPLPLLPGVW
jgi:hypothetical protein